MAVLMSYHKLIERESKNIDWFWKFGTIFFLLLTVISCMIASFSFHRITSAYDDHCILNAEVMFTEKSSASSEPVVTSSSTSVSSAKTSSIVVSDNLDADDCFERNLQIPQEEQNFMDSYEIDTKFTNWGSRVKCEWALHLPIFQCCFSIIVVSFFVICGKGGKAEEGSFLAQPWRIVIPALIFFLVMTIISISYISLVHNGMQKFCDSLTAELPSVTCYDAINAFKILSGEPEPNTFLVFLYTINWVTFALWLFLVIVMILRILFVVDFQLVRVTIKTCEYENANEKSNFRVIDNSKDDLTDNTNHVEFKYEEFIQENDGENNSKDRKSSLKDESTKE